MIKEPTISLPELVDPSVPGSGEYTATEAIVYLGQRADLIAEQREILRRLIATHMEAVKSDANKGDESPEDTAKIEAGLAVQYGRLQKEFKAAYDKVAPPPHVVRDAYLMDLYENFDSYDADKSGGLSLKESRLSVEIYTKLSPTGELTREKIKAGISVSSRPKAGIEVGGKQ